MTLEKKRNEMKNRTDNKIEDRSGDRKEDGIDKNRRYDSIQKIK